jgi:hypothetical protein
MNLLLAAFLVSVVLLALDLWTAPKPQQVPPANLGDHRRAA